MRIVRLAAAGIVTLAAVALAVSALVAFAAGGLFWIALIYCFAAATLFAGARRLRPPRRRFVFARH
jgi:hypothetical protein